MATDDGTPEAFEIPALPYAIGVQWHPEIDEKDSLIASLVDAARERMAS